MGIEQENFPKDNPPERGPENFVPPENKTKVESKEGVDSRMDQAIAGLSGLTEARTVVAGHELKVEEISDKKGTDGKVVKALELLETGIK